MNVMYRKAEERDVIQVCCLQNEWKSEDITYGYEAEVIERIASRLNEYSYIAECDGEVVGFITASIHEAKQMAVMKDGERYIEIEDLYVSSEYRDQGLGSGLLEIVLNEAQNQGIERSLVYSATKELSSVIDFYSKYGYKTWYVQMFK